MGGTGVGRGGGQEQKKQRQLANAVPCVGVPMSQDFGELSFTTSPGGKKWLQPFQLSHRIPARTALKVSSLVRVCLKINQLLYNRIFTENSRLSSSSPAEVRVGGYVPPTRGACNKYHSPPRGKRDQPTPPRLEIPPHVTQY